MTTEAVRRIVEGRNADLLPTPMLSSDEFEDFVERLLHAHRFCPAPLVHVARVERWGRKGDKQDGIDFEGTFSDGAAAAWQCKRQDSLSAADVRNYVDECSFAADRYYLTFSGEASSAAREEIRKHSQWELLDQRGLGRLLSDLPLHKRRQVLDDTWGAQWRRQFLSTPGEDAFIPIAQVAAARLDESNLINDRGILVGRNKELRALRAALNRAADWPSIIVVAGAGGSGKSRILGHALSEAEQDRPQVPVLALGPGRQLDYNALQELPHVPATIFVDDIHRDPDQLAPLLAYSRRVGGTQLVLGSRGQGIDPIKNAIYRAGFTESQIELIPVGPLSKKEARALVEGLTMGLTLPAGLIEHLTTEARDAPYVAVVALNLARRGELRPGYLRLDQGIRSQVLARYEDVLIGTPAGFETDRVRTFLATVAALGTTNFTDAATISALCNFLGLERIALLRLAAAITDQGVLVTRDAVSRVVPEVLADQLLENEAIAFGADTGFVSDLWAAFGTYENWRLLTNLASLEWRLTSRGLPTVIEPIWDQIFEFIDAASLRTLQAFLGASRELAFSQPNRFMDALLRIHFRLDELDSTWVAPEEDDLHVTSWGGRPIQVSDVEQMLPSLLAECARNAPGLLETALDEIWKLGRVDNRPTNSHSDHPRRVLVDSLADIGRLADPTFPSRIVKRVKGWLEVPDAVSNAATPLFALQPLLAKEGSRIRLADRRTFQFEPFLVNAEWAHPLRTTIRELLVEQTAAGDARRAGQAVNLLIGALRSPHGQFGLAVEEEAIRSWEADDLGTISALEVVATTSDSCVVRRLVRRGLEWHTQHASSPAVKKRAAHLLNALDQLVGDDLAEVLMPPHFTTVPSQRGVTSESWNRSGRTLSNDSTTRRMERVALARRELAVEVADRLWATSISVESIERVTRTLDEIAIVLEDKRDGLALLFQVVATDRPQYLTRLIESVDKAQHPAMDAALHVLLGGLHGADPGAARARFATVGTAREGIRLATARMFNALEPAKRTDLHDMRDSGLDEDAEPVRQEYLASLGADLVSNPSDAASMLISRAADSITIERVLLDAWRIQQEFPSRLDPNEAVSLINLIANGDWTEWVAQQLLTQLVPRYLSLILDSLKSATSPDRFSRHTLDIELVNEIRSQPTDVADWLVGEISAGTDSTTLGSVIELINGESFPKPLGDAIAAHVPHLSAEEMVELVHSLESSQTWAATSPALARALLIKARGNGPVNQREIEAQVNNATRPHHWSGTNGVSDELNAALAANEAAAAVEPDNQLRIYFEEAAEILRATIERDRRHYEDEDDDGEKI